MLQVATMKDGIEMWDGMVSDEYDEVENQR